MCVGENIRTIRQQKGLTLNAFGKKIGVSTSFLSDIENGRSLPSLKRLIKIAQTLEVSIDDIMNDHSQVAGESSKPYIFKGLQSIEGKRLLTLISDFDYWNKDKQNLLISIIENIKF